MSDCDDMRERARQADERAERRQDERRIAGETARAEIAKAAKDAVVAGLVRTAVGEHGVPSAGITSAGGVGSPRRRR